MKKLFIVSLVFLAIQFLTGCGGDCGLFEEESTIEAKPVPRGAVLEENLKAEMEYEETKELRRYVPQQSNDLHFSEITWKEKPARLDIFCTREEQTARIYQQNEATFLSSQEFSFEPVAGSENTYVVLISFQGQEETLRVEGTLSLNPAGFGEIVAQELNFYHKAKLKAEVSAYEFPRKDLTVKIRWQGKVQTLKLDLSTLPNQVSIIPENNQPVASFDPRIQTGVAVLFSYQSDQFEAITYDVDVAFRNPGELLVIKGQLKVSSKDQEIPERDICYGD